MVFSILLLFAGRSWRLHITPAGGWWLHALTDPDFALIPAGLAREEGADGGGSILLGIISASLASANSAFGPCFCLHQAQQQHPLVTRICALSGAAFMASILWHFYAHWAFVGNGVLGSS